MSLPRYLHILGPKHNFLGIDSSGAWEKSAVVVVPVPLEKTTTYLKGTAKGPSALLSASHQVELFDEELEKETYCQGIVTLSPLRVSKSQEKALSEIENTVEWLLQEKKWPLLIGGEHTLTVGAVQAFSRLYKNFSVLHLDAHADLRHSYEGSTYNHACVMARVKELCPFVSVGVRSLSVEEAEEIQEDHLSVFTMEKLRNTADWETLSISQLSDTVYVTLDLDVLDPSVLPTVGTPEPGGMGWVELLCYLRKVFQEKHVVGVDVVELCPRPGMEYGVFSAAKLVYRMIGYWYLALPQNALKSETGDGKRVTENG